MEFFTSLFNLDKTKLYRNDIERCIGDFIKDYCEEANIEIEIRLGRFRWKKHAMPEQIEEEWLTKYPDRDGPSPLFNIGNQSEVVLNRVMPQQLSSLQYEFDASITKEHADYISKFLYETSRTYRDDGSHISVKTSLVADETRTDQFGEAIRISRKMEKNSAGEMIKENEPFAFLRKRRLENLDILVPGADYDVRISASIEDEVFDRSFSATEINVFCREKSRMSFARPMGQYDWTKIVNYRVDFIEEQERETLYECEFELSRMAVEELKAKKDTAEFYSCVEAVTNNMRELAYLTTKCYKPLRSRKASSTSSAEKIRKQ